MSSTTLSDVCKGTGAELTPAAATQHTCVWQIFDPVG